MKLRIKLTLLCLVLAILPIAIVGSLAFQTGRRIIEQNSINHLISTNILKSSELNRWIAGNKTSIEELAQRPLIRQNTLPLMSHDIANSEFLKVKENLISDHLLPRLEYGNFSELFILCPIHGIVMASTDSRQEGKYRDIQAYYVEGKKQTYIQNIYYSQGLEQATMTIGTPIRDKQGNLIAVLAGRLDLTELSRIMATRSGESRTEDTYLVNQFNFFVTEPQFAQNYALKKAVRTEGVNAGLAGKDGVGFYKNYRGEAVIGAYKWLPQYQMCILTELDQSEAYAPIIQFGWTLISVAVLTTLTVAFLAIFFSRTLTRPIQKLAEGAEEIGRGNLDHVVGTQAQDEIGELSRAFDLMTQALKKTTVSRDVLLQERDFSDSVINSLPGIFYLFNEKGRFIRWNRNFEKVTEYPAEMIPEISPLDLFSGEDKDRVAEKFQNVFITGEELVEVDLVSRSGKRTPYFLTGLNVSIGEKKHLIGTGLDITDRKQTEEELAKLSRAVEQSPVSVVISDPQGNIEYVNPKFTQITGYTLEEVKGQNSRILKSGETSPEEYRKLWETITSGLVWHGEFHNRRKDGSLFWERASISPVRNTKGTITHFLAVKEDITVEKSLEMQLLQAQKLESIGRLAGGVAHDFNNMLNVILGYTEIGATKLPKDHPAHRDLEEVKSAAIRSVDLTRQLLAFARKQTVSPVVLNINKTVSGMLKMLQRLIGEDIDLAWKPGDDLWNVKLDPSQIDQLLANLMVNARDAIAGVGKVTIETENVGFDQNYCATHTGFIPGQYVMLAVSDNGCGMDPQTLTSIFEPFYTTKALGVGTGLGLSTVYGIVKQNNGFINVYSEPGYGTTFKIYLPGTFETTEMEILNHDLLPRHGTETVLLVEDEQSILNLGQKILESFGYTVISAKTPLEALALAEHHQGPIHLLITDVVMPEMNGKALKDNLIDFRPDIRVLYMSGYTSNVIAHHGVLEKGIHFLQKPFSVKTLAAKVREALDKDGII